MKIRWSEHARLKRTAYSILVGKTEGKSSRERPRHKRKDNTETDTIKKQCERLSTFCTEQVPATGYYEHYFMKGDNFDKKKILLASQEKLSRTIQAAE
jgi:hypothetical protein